MANEIIESIIVEVEKFNDEIREALSSKNINNTMEASKSLRIQSDENSVQSLGIFYLEFLDTGRGPGKMPPFEPIMQWAIQKTGQERDELYGLVKYVQQKIARLGTEIFQNNAKGIELTEKIVTLKENLNKQIQNGVKKEIIQGLNRFKKLYEMKI